MTFLVLCAVFLIGVLEGHQNTLTWGAGKELWKLGVATFYVCSFALMWVWLQNTSSNPSAPGRNQAVGVAGILGLTLSIVLMLAVGYEIDNSAQVKLYADQGAEMLSTTPRMFYYVWVFGAILWLGIFVAWILYHAVTKHYYRMKFKSSSNPSSTSALPA